MNFITPSTEKRPFLINETSVLKDSTNLIKRKPLSYNFLDISNKSSFKKIKRFSNEKETTDKENIFPCF